MMFFLCVVAVGLVSAAGVLLLEQYILLTREPVAVVCDGGTENTDAWIDELEERLTQ